MKSILFLLSGLTLILWSGCSKHENPMQPPMDEQVQTGISGIPSDIQARIKAYEEHKRDVQAKIEAYEARKYAQANALRNSLDKSGRTTIKPPRGINVILKVPDDYPTIQQAVDAASPGDKILVKSGTYSETVSIYTPNLRIIAAHNASVHVFGAFAIWNTSAIVVQGFCVHGDAGSAGLSAWQCTRIAFRNNLVAGTFAGIDLNQSSYCTVSKNEVSNSEFGLYMYKSDSNFIKSNKLRNNLEAGIMTLYGNANIYIGNTAIDNTFDGINFGHSNGNRLCGSNYFNNNLFGFVLSRSDNNRIGPRNFANGNIAFGLWIDSQSDNNTFANFTALDNEYDINKESGNTGNRFIRCKFGTCYGDCP